MNDVVRDRLAGGAPEGAAGFRTSFARAMGTVVRCAAGDTVFREGDPADCMYVILGGSVEIVSRGREIERVGEGRALGIVSLIDHKSRNVSARAVEDCELALIDARRFRFMVEETPNFVWYVLEELVGRLRATTTATR